MGIDLGLGVLYTVVHSAESQAPSVRRTRDWVSMGGWVLKSHCIRGPSVLGTKSDADHSVRRWGPASAANPVPRWESIDPPGMEHSPCKIQPAEASALCPT